MLGLAPPVVGPQTVRPATEFLDQADAVRWVRQVAANPGRDGLYRNAVLDPRDHTVEQRGDEVLVHRLPSFSPLTRPPTSAARLPHPSAPRPPRTPSRPRAGAVPLPPTRDSPPGEPGPLR